MILKKILTAVRDYQPVTRTRIGYGAFVSSGQAKDYLEAAERSQLVEHVEEGTSTMYVLTSKGLDVLDMVSRLEKLVPEFLSEVTRRQPRIRQEAQKWRQDNELMSRIVLLDTA